MIARFFTLILAATQLLAAPDDSAFDSLIETYVNRSPALEQAREALRAAESRNISTHLWYLPELSIDGSQSLGKLYGSPSTSSSRGLSLAAELNIWKFGADVSAKRSATAQERALAHGVLSAQLAAESSAVAALTGYLDAKMRLEIQEAMVDILKRALDIAKARSRKGLLSRQEAEMVEIDFENGMSNLADAKAILIAAQASLETDLGRPANLSIAWPWKKVMTQAFFSKRTLNDLSNRPDWKTAEQSEVAASEAANSAWGTMLPTVDLTANYGFLHQLDTNSSGNHWSAQLTVSIPLFDKLANYGSYKAAIHQKKYAELGLETTRRNARKDFEAARGAYETARQVAEMRDRTVVTSQKLLTDNLKRFEKGAIDVNDLQTDQSRLLTSQTYAITGWRQVHVNFVRACHSTGIAIKQCLEN